jgi:hypothetical protein
MKAASSGRRIRDAVLLLIAISIGVGIAWVDSRPHWDDTGITAASLLLSAGALGMIEPRRPWRWGLAIGAWIPLHWMAGTRTASVMAGACVVLAIPLVGAWAGAAIRRGMKMALR